QARPPRRPGSQRLDRPRQSPPQRVVVGVRWYVACPFLNACPLAECAREKESDYMADKQQNKDAQSGEPVQLDKEKDGQQQGGQQHGGPPKGNQAGGQEQGAKPEGGQRK